MNKDIDGFRRPGALQDRPGGSGIPRRPSLDTNPHSRMSHQRASQPLSPLDQGQNKPKSEQPFDMGTLPKDINLDVDTKTDKKKKFRKHWWQFWRKKQNRKPWSRKKKIIIWTLVILFILLLAAAAVLAWKLWHNTGEVFKGNPLQVFQNEPLKEDQYGRSNIVLFGTSADDPNHPGADLTDSIMVISLDQDKKDAFMFSVPRDLWIEYDQACLSGHEGKINEVYMCAKNGGADAAAETAGQKALSKKVGEVFGMDVQYSVHVNYSVVQQAIDALGGVDITIESDDPRGVLDRNFDWRCNYECYYVNWPNGPVHLDGEHALYLAQARNESGGYGLSRGNFDREENQRKIMIAAKEKATEIGFLANPVKVLELMDALGDNIKTNFKTSEVRTLADVGSKTASENIQSISLIDQDPMLLTTGTASTGASIVEPVSGLYNYTDIQAFIRSYQTGSAEIMKEKAVVDILNGTETPGLAQEKADMIAAEGITLGAIDNAPEGTYGAVTIYDLSQGKAPATKKRLEEVLGVSATSDPLPAGIETTASFVVIVGQ